MGSREKGRIQLSFVLPYVSNASSNASSSNANGEEHKNGQAAPKSNADFRSMLLKK